jgi:hypothetical protein
MSANLPELVTSRFYVTAQTLEQSCSVSLRIHHSSPGLAGSRSTPAGLSYQPFWTGLRAASPPPPAEQFLTSRAMDAHCMPRSHCILRVIVCEGAAALLITARIQLAGFGAPYPLAAEVLDSVSQIRLGDGARRQRHKMFDQKVGGERGS